jgi:uncharacterized protein YdeI (YjbR/CyaY-like superfamily)
MQEKDTDTFYPTSQQAWRTWLQENHRSKQSVWLVCYKKKANFPTVLWSDAVDEAICFGWIDSKRITIDDDKFMQFFTKRKPKGTWSKVNKEKIKQLTDKGLMTEAGFECIEKAKQNGSWTFLDEVEALIIPKDLEEELNSRAGSREFFLGLSKSVRKSILQWIVLAKQVETRQKRIIEIAKMASLNLKPKQFR